MDLCGLFGSLDIEISERADESENVICGILAC